MVVHIYGHFLGNIYFWGKLGQNGLKPFVRIRSTICVFDPFLTHFLCQNSPFSRRFGIFGSPNRATTSSKRWTPLTHFGTHVFGLELAACRNLVATLMGL